MILTVHIDNRVISLGCYEKAELLVSSSIAVNPLGTADQYAAEIQQVLRFRGIDTDAIDGAVISSVVPALTSRLKQAADHLINGGKTLTVGAGIKTGLDIRWDSAASVGSDFICNAVAALREFTPPLVVIHFAGATTFTAIDTHGALVGKSILPGVEESMAHLCQSAAQLPEVSFAAKAPLFGRSTADAIRSGVLYGTTSAVEGMVSRYTEMLGGSVTTVATGGEVARAVVSLCGDGILFRPNLLHDGLYLLYEKNRQESKK